MWRVKLWAGHPHPIEMLTVSLLKWVRAEPSLNSTLNSPLSKLQSKTRFALLDKFLICQGACIIVQTII